MKKHFIQQIVFAVALAVIVFGINSVQAQTPTSYTPEFTPVLVLSDNGNYLTGLPIADAVLRKKDGSFPRGIPWDASKGWWVWRMSGNTISDPLVSFVESNNNPPKNCYVQEYHKTSQNYSTIGGYLELKAEREFKYQQGTE